MPKSPLKTRDDLSMAYTPGVARVSSAIAADPEKVWNLTVKQNAVAVVTDGSAVLGLGDIGPEAALPRMEGKAMLFKEFGGIDAWPVCFDTNDPDEIVRTVAGLDRFKAELADRTNARGASGSADDALAGADVYIGLSTPGAVTPEAIRTMATDAVVFAMANPNPEVSPEEIEDSVAVLGTGRSDYPNQINNVLAFPGVFRGALDVRARTITPEMEIAAARALAAVVEPGHLAADYVIPSVFDRRVAPAVAAAVASAAAGSGVARRTRPAPITEVSA
jgi:malic enzyme